MTNEVVIGLWLTALYFTIGMILGKLFDMRDDHIIWMALFWPIPVVVTLLFGMFAIIVITFELIKLLVKTIVKGE